MPGQVCPPWALSPTARKVGHRNARLARLIRAGILQPLTKQQARDVLASHTTTATEQPTTEHQPLPNGTT